MIIVFFVPGMFGSTIEALIRSFTSEHIENAVPMKLTKDGSMHTFKKLFHPAAERDEVLRLMKSSVSVCTPIYPLTDIKLQELADVLILSDDDKLILIYADSHDSAEINMLFQYHKIVKGVLNRSLDVICGKNEQQIIKWNSSYTSWRDMQNWELREWLSIFYPSWIQEWVDSKNVTFSQNPILLTNRQILNNLEETFTDISNQLGLNIINQSELTKFCETWTASQQYIIDEYNLLETIVTKTLRNEDFDWHSLNIVAESIIQKRLRDAGFELKCYNLNNFPTNSKTLAKLLEKV